MSDTTQSVPNLDALGFELPTPEQGLIEAKRRLAQTFRRSELVWLLNQRYDPITPSWLIDVLRQGAMARWVRQRYRFDEQAEVLYFLGESPLRDDEFRATRRAGKVFPVPEWQDRPS